MDIPEDPPVKDVSSTTFGFVIGYLLPGFAGMFGIAFFAPPVGELFSQFIEAESNVGRFLLVILCSLVVGLEVSVARWVIFEKILCYKHKRDRAKYGHLSDQSKLSAFRAAVDEHYRYHQFWGGMAVVIPLVAWGIVSQTSGVQAYTLSGVFVVLEALNIAGGVSAYVNYIDRTNRILEGSQYEQRMGTDRRRPRDETRPPATAATSPSASTTSAPTATTTKEKVANGESCDVTSAESP